jgi:hypothetical protein
MLKRLEVDALRADLASVERLLSNRTPENDPVGWLQFNERREQIQNALAELEAHSYRSTAAVGLFFGGRPVLGSHGIVAAFGAKAIEQFQQLLSTLFAAYAGPIGARGPVKQRDRTQMMLTAVARGSFGFILEQTEDEQLVDSPVKKVLEETIDLIYRIAGPDEELFELMTDAVDARVLQVLSGFFKHLSDAGATVKFVEEQREFLLSRADVDRGHDRTRNLSIADHEQKLEGKLYLLPKTRRFELTLVDGETISGAVSDQALDPLLDLDGDVVRRVLGEMVIALLKRRDIESPTRVLRSSYLLLGVFENKG